MGAADAAPGLGGGQPGGAGPAHPEEAGGAQQPPVGQQGEGGGAGGAQPPGQRLLPPPELLVLLVRQVSLGALDKPETEKILISIACLAGILTRKFSDVNGDSEEAIIVRDYRLPPVREVSDIWKHSHFSPLDAVTVHRFIGSRLSLHGR